MSIYTVFIILLTIIRVLFTSIFVFITYKPTKEIIIKNLKKELRDFHCEHLQNNYHLDICNLNSFDKLNEAMVLIKSEPEFFDRIPGEDIMSTNIAISVLNNYRSFQNRILFIIGLTMAIELGIKVGVSLL